MSTHKKVKLVLQNGRTMEGWGFGYDGPCDGEVVFSTAMVGYTESLTDPSFSGQILCLTYPILGNYGITEMERDENGLFKGFESEKIHIRGLVVTDYSEEYSHWDAVKSLGAWMDEQKIPGIFGIDPRLHEKVGHARRRFLAPLGVTLHTPFGITLRMPFGVTLGTLLFR